jgi:hypothetical protein
VIVVYYDTSLIARIRDQRNSHFYATASYYATVQEPTLSKLAQRTIEETLEELFSTQSASRIHKLSIVRCELVRHFEESQFGCWELVSLDSFPVEN